jgi:CheY-like chemotaxis protein
MAEACAVFVIAARKRNSLERTVPANAQQNERYFACDESPHTDMSRILFVSHDASLRSVASRVLTKAGFYVATVSHAGHASLACLKGPGFDVLIVENELFGGHGGTIARRLRRYCPDLQVVRMCEPGTMIAGEGIAVVRPLTGDDLIDAVLRSATLMPAA